MSRSSRIEQYRQHYDVRSLAAMLVDHEDDLERVKDRGDAARAEVASLKAERDSLAAQNGALREALEACRADEEAHCFAGKVGFRVATHERMLKALSLPPPAALAALTQRVRAEALGEVLEQVRDIYLTEPTLPYRTALGTLLDKYEARTSPKKDEP